MWSATIAKEHILLSLDSLSPDEASLFLLDIVALLSGWPCTSSVWQYKLKKCKIVNISYFIWG